MKTNYLVKLTLMMVITSIIFASCSKTDSEPVTTTASTLANSHHGIIYDKGTTEVGLRHMQVVLSNQNYSTTNANGIASINEALVSIVFYTNTDGMIPSGVYKYSDTPDAGPFTFGTALLYPIKDNFSTAPPIASITSGSVTVSKVDSQYHIIFECVLSNGKIFQSEFHGAMSYADN
jgi:hypothetical protein